VKKKIFQSFKSAMIFSFVVIMMLSFVATASATNGYFSHGYSVKNMALAGTGTALPLDSIAASTNPAGMVFVGNRFDLGISFFNPNREYTVSGTPDPPPAFGLKPGTFESGSNWFIVPALGANKMINENSSLGISIYGNGGMNTDYDEKTYYGSSPTGVDLMQLFVVPTYALKLHPKHAIGISPIIAYQRFEARGLESFAFYSNDSDNLSNNQHDNSYGYGGRIGYQGEVLPGLSLGASYQTRIYMSRLKKYAGLFAEDGDFDIPQNWSIGMAYNATTALTLAFDVQKIYYSDINSVNNPLTTTNLKPGSLGKDNGPGFGWEDMTVYKFGVQWQSNPEWTWRAGYSYGKQPIPDSEVLFNILAPGVIEQHATAGVTKKIGNNQELDFALMRAFPHEISGKNTLDPSQTIKLKMDQWEISLGYSYKF
jgi:long-chain fatty acid transport protein